MQLLTLLRILPQRYVVLYLSHDKLVNLFQDTSAEVNDAPQENLKSIYEQAPVEHINTRPAMSFAAATSGHVGVSKEVSVSA
jgi:hypothetical protein